MNEGGVATWKTLLPILACPVCRESLTTVAILSEHDAVLGHDSGDCQERYPVIDDVARLLTGLARARLYHEHSSWFADPRSHRWFGHWASYPTKPQLGDAVVSRFDREWSAFAEVRAREHAELFREYFDVVPDTAYGAGSIVLDAGCGAGRWSAQVAAHGARVISLDLGRSVEIAHRNGRRWNMECIQADVTALPFVDHTFDFVYSLGVLHHIEATESAASELCRVLRPGGYCLIYLYYAMDNRGPMYRALYQATDMFRRALSRSPQMILEPVSTMIALLVYLPLARLSRELGRLGLTGVARSVPLSYYAKRSFRTMRNDSLDRFGTRLEKRFTRSQVEQLMQSAGLAEIHISDSPPYWHGIGRRPTKDGAA